MISEGTARGKLILFGEHAAVWGHPAVGLPLPGTLRLARHSEVPGPAYGMVPPEDREIINRLTDILGRETLMSGAPEGTWYAAGHISRAGGFGSSAALCVALSRMALEIRGGAYNPRVHRLANRLERLFHGNPSGIDTGMAGDLEPAIWRAADGDIPSREALRLPELHLAVGALPRKGNTAATVGALGERMRSGDETVAAAFQKLGATAEDFIALCRKPPSGTDRAPAAAELAHRAQNILASLNLSTVELDRLLDIARGDGALGGKLSGGGTGGAFWLVFPDRRTRDLFIGRERKTGRLRSECGLLGDLMPLDTASMYPLEHPDH